MTIDAANLVWKASEFAKKAHKNQWRKYTANTPYITHPARVASRIQLLNGYCKRDLAEMVAVGWLHDVIEDCNVTKGDLILEGFTPAIVDGVESLTNPSKTHPELNRAARKQMDREHCANLPEKWRIIKLIDRIDNLRDMVWAEIGFMRKYLVESDLLFNALNIKDLTLESEYIYAANFLMWMIETRKSPEDMEMFREVEY